MLAYRGENDLAHALGDAPTIAATPEQDEFGLLPRRQPQSLVKIRLRQQVKLIGIKRGQQFDPREGDAAVFPSPQSEQLASTWQVGGAGPLKQMKSVRVREITQR